MGTALAEESSGKWTRRPPSLTQTPFYIYTKYVWSGPKFIQFLDFPWKPSRSNSEEMRVYICILSYVITLLESAVIWVRIFDYIEGEICVGKRSAFKISKVYNGIVS